MPGGEEEKAGMRWRSWGMMPKRGNKKKGLDKVMITVDACLLWYPSVSQHIPNCKVRVSILKQWRIFPEFPHSFLISIQNTM